MNGGGPSKWATLLGAAAAWLVAAGVAMATASAEDVLRQSGISGGLVVVVGCADADLLAGLRAGEAFTVVGLDTDPAKAAAAREALAKRGALGPVTAMAWDGERLPFADRVVNLCVQVSGFSVQEEEAVRVLVPGGVAVRIPETRNLKPETTVKPRDARLDDWSHYLHDASNNAVSKDRVVGPPKGLQWWAGPYSSRSHNWVPSTGAMVSNGGRLFYLRDDGPIAAMPHKGTGMNWSYERKPMPAMPEEWSLIARDAFNGKELWRRPLEGFGNTLFEDPGFGPTAWNIWSLPLSVKRRLVATPQRIYVTLKYRGGLSALDAATGKTVWDYTPPEGAAVDEIVVDSGNALLKIRRKIPAKLQQPFYREGLDAAWGKTFTGEDYDKYVEAQPPEMVAGLDAGTGRELWRFDAPRVGAETLCARDGAVLYYDGTHVVCRNVETGVERWRRAADSYSKRGKYHRQSYYLGAGMGFLMAWDGHVYFSGGKGTTCYDLKDGRELWAAGINHGMGFGHPTGLWVVNGKLMNENTSKWFKPIDALKGTQLAEFFKEGPWAGTHGRCHRGVMTERYYMGIAFGIEFWDLATGEMVSDNRWLRSECALGYLPANGLLYHSPDPCACWLGGRIRGYEAFAPVAPALDYDRVDEGERLTAGPAFEKGQKSEVRGRNGEVSGVSVQVSGASADSNTPDTRHPTPEASDWPQYRHDAQRSGRASCAVPADLRVLWRAELGSPYDWRGHNIVSGLTPPVISAGRVFLSRKDANEIVCLDAGSGKVVWRYLTPAFVDSPPTIAGVRCQVSGVREEEASGAPETRNPKPDSSAVALAKTETSLCLFGCRDGYVYGLRASDGVLAWRFRAAPAEMLTLLEGRPGSKWPVHGSVLVQDGAVYCAAGHSSFLDGGIHFFKLDPATGKMLGHARADGPRYPFHEQNPFVEVTTNQWGRVERNPDGYHARYVDIEGARADILVSDGTDIRMGQTRLTPDMKLSSILREQVAGTAVKRRWLRPLHMFLDDSYNNRVGWHYSDTYYGGGNAAGAANAGKLLVFDEKFSYGAQWEGTDAGRYPNHLLGAGTRLNADRLETENKAEGFDALRKEKPVWSLDLPMIVRAMVLANAPDGSGRTLFVAGPPEPKPGAADQLDPYRGKGPGTLLALAAADGKKLLDLDLPAQPVFDGMAAAGGKLFVALTDGSAICLGTKP